MTWHETYDRAVRLAELTSDPEMCVMYREVAAALDERDGGLEAQRRYAEAHARDLVRRELFSERYERTGVDDA